MEMAERHGIEERHSAPLEEEGSGALKRRPRRMVSAVDPGGFTLVELIIVILLIGILVTLAVPVFISAQAMARRNVCWHNQRSIEYALMRWSAEHPDENFVSDDCLPGGGEAYIDLEGEVPGDESRSLALYFDSGSDPFDCPSNGKDVGQVVGCDYITDGISVACLTDNQIGIKSDSTPFEHDRPCEVGWDHAQDMDNGEPGEDVDDGEKDDSKTPLGDTFEEISSGMIELIRKYYEENGRYPRSRGDYAYTDIGLDQAEWELPVDHIYYEPNGQRVRISPEGGYAFEVTDANGKDLYLSSESNWDLLYDLKNDKWYFKNTGAKNEIDISTLEVVKDSGKRK
ncbi:MAG: prepilin-type N-terminal cleavage/methylation domain-containing protein [Actinomycetota bacterium]|nr:prepilin-type N-terminal cleavage/methylation domain-containing protein [Actinomycetota bacterium]